MEKSTLVYTQVDEAQDNLRHKKTGRSKHPKNDLASTVTLEEDDLGKWNGDHDENTKGVCNCSYGKEHQGMRLRHKILITITTKEIKLLKRPHDVITAFNNKFWDGTYKTRKRQGKRKIRWRLYHGNDNIKRKETILPMT